jgi:quercetin dioxygenase-like cupin family protein
VSSSSALGEMTYALPRQTPIYKAGDFFFESGDINHVVADASQEAVVINHVVADASQEAVVPD